MHSHKNLLRQCSSNTCEFQRGQGMIVAIMVQRVYNFRHLQKHYLHKMILRILFVVRMQLQLHKQLSREMVFACASVSHSTKHQERLHEINFLENCFCCQVPISNTRSIPLRIIYLIISWTVVQFVSDSRL